VTVVYGNQIAMEPTLEQALVKIFGGRAPAATAARRRPRSAGRSDGQREGARPAGARDLHPRANRPCAAVIGRDTALSKSG